MFPLHAVPPVQLILSYSSQIQALEQGQNDLELDTGQLIKPERAELSDQKNEEVTILPYPPSGPSCVW